MPGNLLRIAPAVEGILFPLPLPELSNPALTLLVLRLPGPTQVAMDSLLVSLPTRYLGRVNI